MKKKTKDSNSKYKNHSIGKVKVIKDFLPPPEQLIPKENTIKVTLILNKSSVDYFKKIAKKNNAPYQAMIRNLLDQYVTHYRNHQ